MITHVVLFRLKDRSADSIRRAEEKLRSLRGNIPELKHIEVGKDILKTERSYDIALIARFDTREDLDAYQRHPFHVEVAKYITEVRESAVAVDYESAI